jgi:hypothetical protein
MGSVEDQGRGYNGWANYETWAVALWIGNEPGSYVFWEQDQAEECYREAVKAQLGDFEFEAREDPAAVIDRAKATEAAAVELAGRLKRELDDEAELPRAVDGTMYADLLNAALQEVNWHEVAAHYVADLDRAEIEQEEANAVRIEPEDGDTAG